MISIKHVQSTRPCKLITLLRTLPASDLHRMFIYLPISVLLRLSVCCRSLRNRIRNNTLLWKEIYKHHFMFGAYHAKEWEFVYWCARNYRNSTDMPDNVPTSLKSLDWYDVYRRHVCIEHNWRLCRSNTTDVEVNIDLNGKQFNNGAVAATGVVLKGCSKETNDSIETIYSLESLTSSSIDNSSINNDTVSAYEAKKAIPWRLNPSHCCGKDEYPLMSDCYTAIIGTPETRTENGILEIRDRHHHQVLHTCTIPIDAQLELVSGRWAIVSEHLNKDLVSFRLDQFSMMNYKGSIDGHWHALCFYKVEKGSAVVYTARLEANDSHRITWALYRFSATKPVKQLRLGWLYLSQRPQSIPFRACALDASRVVLEMGHNEIADMQVVHSVASAGKSCAAQGSMRIPESHATIALLQEGFTGYLFDRVLVYEKDGHDYTETFYWPFAIAYEHIIGNLYVFREVHVDGISESVLIDMNKKQDVRYIYGFMGDQHESAYLMMASMYFSTRSNFIAITDYSAV
ncbi:hypothetical protein BDF19DRAFT_435691 [Syncephalis fuscata]|nr:hypothetical protein BDF19DRAFT_435691 [Syncephalis fuscata]